MGEIRCSGSWDQLSDENKEHITRRVERVLSEILSDKYDAKITITLEKKNEKASKNAEPSSNN